MSTSKDLAVTGNAHEGAEISNGSTPFRPANTAASMDTNAPLVHVIPPRTEDLQPSYAKVVGTDAETNEHGWYGSMINTLGNVVGFMGAVPCCICCPNPYRPVSQGQVGLITKFGRFHRAVDPGLVKINPLSEKLIQVDVKIQIVEVPQQVCMTKDNVSVHLTSVIYYHIVSPHKAAFGISNIRQALVERTMTTLRHVVGARVLQDVIERREEIAQSISEIIEEVAAGWGVRVESMLMKDIIFSRELQDSLSMAAQSKRIGESKIIAARAEVESAKLMRKAADILSSAPAMQIRYLESLQAISKTANAKVIFIPTPTPMFSGGVGAIAPAGNGEGPSNYGGDSSTIDDDAFQKVINTHVMENM